MDSKMIIMMIIFGMIGVVNTGVDIGLFWLLTGLLGVAPLIANVMSFSCAALGSFLFNRSITFRAAAQGGQTRSQALRFMVTTGVVMAASTLSLALFMQVVPVMGGKLLSVGVSFVIGFVLQRFWVFAPAKREAAPVLQLPHD